MVLDFIEILKVIFLGIVEGITATYQQHRTYDSCGRIYHT